MRPPFLSSKLYLTGKETSRYASQIALPQLGIEGQKKLKSSSALIIGIGGLGSVVSLYLAAAGVGRLGIVDHDTVSISDLQRQILYSEEDLEKPKALVAKERLEKLNPNIAVEMHHLTLTKYNALDIMEDYDVVIDASDNFQTRYLVNDACALLTKPDIYGSIYRFYGQVSVFKADEGPCYRCLMQRPPPPELAPSCAEGGVLGALPGVIGLLQANEALKIILGIGKPLIGRLLLVDLLATDFGLIELRKDPSCAICSEPQMQDGLVDYDDFCSIGSRRIAEESLFITPSELKEKIDRSAYVTLIDVRSTTEYEICRIEGAVHIPLEELYDNVSRIPLSGDVVVYCHLGTRSLIATKILRELGIKNARCLAGGIDAWAAKIDSSIPRY